MLDEPTNHLDLATKEMLVEALKDFEGTMIFVSHDRVFLRGLGSSVLELGGKAVQIAIPAFMRDHMLSTFKHSVTKRQESLVSARTTNRALSEP